MTTPLEILNKFPPHPTITIMKLREAVNLHQQEQEYDFFGFKLKVNPALRGMQTLILSGGNAYYWPDITDVENGKIIELPPMPEPELRLEWKDVNIKAYHGL